MAPKRFSLFAVVVTCIGFVVFVFGLALLLGIGIAHAEGKPSLKEGLIAGVVQCPDGPTPCLLVQTPTKVYVVKGDGPGKEEAIWEVDKKKIQAANEMTPVSTYLTLVWKAGKPGKML